MGVNGKYLVQRFSLTISKSLVYLNLLYAATSVNISAAKGLNAVTAD